MDVQKGMNRQTAATRISDAPPIEKDRTSTMAEATKPTYKSLSEHLKACQTVTDLFKLANSDAFRDASHALSAADLDTLREDYRAMQIQLDGRVKLDQFDGQIIQIVGVEWWHSDTYDQGATGGDGVTIFFRQENAPAPKRYKAATSSAPIVRFCNRFANVVPSEQSPTRVQIKLIPVSDPERAAKGQRIWTIKMLPTPQAAGPSPF